MKKIKKNKDWLKVDSEKKSIASFIDRNKINYIKSELFATTITLMDKGDIVLATNDFGLYDLFKFTLGNRKKKVENPKIFSRMGVNEFDQIHYANSTYVL
ncbi:MAG: hypothetical protein AABW81_03615 [Nanoarchaeota archaeon]